MQFVRFTPLALGVGLVAGCGDNVTLSFPTTDCSKVTTAHCVEALALAESAPDLGVTAAIYLDLTDISKTYRTESSASYHHDFQSRSSPAGAASAHSFVAPMYSIGASNQT